MVGESSFSPGNCWKKGRFIPKYANVANAYGAALAEISGTIDQVVSLNDRENILETLQAQALQATLSCEGLMQKRIYIIIPYHDVPNQMARVIVMAAGHRLNFLSFNCRKK